MVLGAAAGLEGAGEGDLAEQARGGDRVAGQEHAITAVDHGPVPPGPAWQVEGAGAAVGEALAPPGLSLLPAGIAEVQQVLQALQRGGGCLARLQRHLRLDQGVARGGHGGIGDGVILGPAGLIQVGDDEGVAAPSAQAQVQRQGAAAVPVQRVVTEQLLGRVQGGRHDHRWLGQPVHPRAELDPDAEGPRSRLQPCQHARPATDHIACPWWHGGGPQQPLPRERGRQSARVVVEGDHTEVVRGRRGRLLTELLGGPGMEALVHRGAAAPPREHAQHARWREAVEPVPPAEADAGEGAERHVRRRPDQVALVQPPPQRPVVIEDVRALVGDERWRAGPGPAAERLVGLVEADARAVLGTGDARHQAGEPATDHRDVCHVWTPWSPGLSTERSWEPSGGSMDLQGVELERHVGPAQQGDPLAMAALLRGLAPWVGRICGSIALDDGDDAMQETMIRVLKGIRSLREPAALRGWVRRIAVREAIKLAQARRDPLLLDRLPERAVGDAAEVGADNADVLRRLTPEQRAILVLRDLEGFSEAEAATLLGVERGTVKSRLHRARQAFRRRWTG